MVFPQTHRSLSARLAASRRLATVGVAGRLLVDSMQDAASVLLGAVPERLMMVERGAIVYMGAMGPYGYSLGELEEQIKARCGEP